MRQNRHYQIFWLMCNLVGGFGFGLDIRVVTHKMRPLWGGMTMCFWSSRYHLCV